MELRDLLLQAVPSGNREGKGRDGYRSKVAGQGVRFPLGPQKGDRHGCCTSQDSPGLIPDEIQKPDLAGGDCSLIHLSSWVIFEALSP